VLGQDIAPQLTNKNCNNMDLAVLWSEHIPCEKIKGKGNEQAQPDQRINTMQRIFTELIIFQHRHLKFKYI